MSTILYKKLVTELSQEMTVSSVDRLHIASISPWLLVHNAPSGTFTLSVIRNAVTIFTQNFTSAEILTSIGTTDQYAHVFFPIIPLDLLQLENDDYTFKLSASGYTASESSHLGWCQQYENLQNDLGYTPRNDIEMPLALRVKVYK